MKIDIRDNDALAAIPPLSLMAYVRSQGWSKREEFGKTSVVFVKENEPEIILPHTDDLGDYPAIVRNLIAILSDAEERGELQVYRDLVGADKDVIRLRAPGHDEDGTMPLDDGVGFFGSSYNLLLSAACAAYKKDVSYRAGSIKQASDYMKKVLLGQTEQGSFIVNFLAPVPPSLRPEQGNIWKEMPPEPFERQVTFTFVQALHAAKRAAEAALSSDGYDAFYYAINSGVSANLCEALGDLIEFGNGFDVSLTWAKTRPLENGRQLVGFDKASGPIFHEAARAFRAIEPRHDEILNGVVFRLKRDPQQERGVIGLRVFLDGTPIAVTASVSAEVYHQAVMAHDRRALVEIHGDLKRVGQRWHIDPLYELAIIRDDLFDEEQMIE